MRCDPQFLPLANKIDKLQKKLRNHFFTYLFDQARVLALLLLMSTTTKATAIANIGLDHHRYNHDSRSAATGSSGTASSKPDQVATIQVAAAPPLSRYESQKRRDWNTFGQYLKNQRPPISLSHCSYTHVLEFMRYLDQFGKTKVHLNGCVFFGQPDPPAPCTCPLRQAWGSLDALIGRLRAAYEEHGGSQESNPFGNGAIRVYLREVRDCQSKARGIPYKKKKRKLVHHMTKQQTDMANDAQHNKQALLKEHPYQISK